MIKNKNRGRCLPSPAALFKFAFIFAHQLFIRLLHCVANDPDVISVKLSAPESADGFAIPGITASGKRLAAKNETRNPGGMASM
ncbi:MAG: hypothetical protein C0593_08715 [Marinilabiliales bacterium]|nr:MAG: hypothetical protein C0593_08715 [Marinilabiliales bacterium]